MGRLADNWGIFNSEALRRIVEMAARVDFGRFAEAGLELAE